MDNQSHAPPVTGGDLLTSAELAKAQRKIAELTNRAFSWTNLSNFTAKVTLLVFGLIWFGSWLNLLTPTFGISQNPWRIVPQELLYGLITLAVSAGLAFACTVVPSIFWSSLIAQTPAAELMNKLYAKYGRSGYVIAWFGAVLFTYLGFIVFQDYLSSRPNLRDSGGLLFLMTVVCTFLAIVFPAWALNKTTPRQWIDGMIQAREVARLQHILQLEEMIGAAMLARADALLHADLLAMTFEERVDNNRQVAALMATAERRVNRSLGRVGRTFGSLHGMSLDIQTGDDDQIVRGYAHLAEVMTFADDKTGRLADAYDHYVTLLPEAEPIRQIESAPPAAPQPAAERVQAEDRLAAALERSSLRLSEAKARADAEKALLAQELERSVQPPATAETVRMPASHSQSQPVTASQEGATVSLPKPNEWGDKYLVCRELLIVPFNVQELATVAKVSYSTADRYRKAWLEGGYLAATDTEGKYFWDDPE